MTGGDNFDDLNAALASAFAMPEVAALVDKEKRRKREKKYALSPDDGRRARATGRTKQFNCKMKPELHKRLVQASRTTGVPITVICEDALDAYLKQREGKSDA